MQKPYIVLVLDIPLIFLVIKKIILPPQGILINIHYAPVYPPPGGGISKNISPQTLPTKQKTPQH